jgi:dipeptidase
LSYAIYVGRNLTADGLSYLAGYGDEPSSHWLEVAPRQRHAAGATIEVGVTASADLPGRRSQIPQVAETARHIRVDYSYYMGTPAPLTNGGLNEHGVAVRDVWSTSRDELVNETPKDQTGPNYSDLARLVLERARSAREGVELMGALMAEHGHASYGGNSHLIADSREGWVVIQFAGGHGLWCAERLSENSIRVSRPGYIGVVPQEPHPDFLYSANFFDVARKKGWFDPASGMPFDANRIYGDGRMRWDGVAMVEERLKKQAASAEKIRFTDLVWALRDPQLTGDSAGYGQIVPLLGDVPSVLRHLWHTQVGAVAAPFVPVHLGVREVPEEYRCHRYLTAGEEARFMDARRALKGEPNSTVPQGIEATRSAVAVFKRLLYLSFQDAGTFLPELHGVFAASEARLAERQKLFATAAAALLAAGDDEAARDLLTYFTSTELRAALAMAEDLARAMEIRLRAGKGLNLTHIPIGPDQVW